MPVDQATVDRLRKYNWGADPFEATPSGGEPYRTRLVNGRCFFLDATNRCRIHSEVSYDAKPPACRLFPLAVLEVGGRQYARLSFWCPTVAADTGKPLDQQGRWLREAAKYADRRPMPLMLNEAVALPARDLERLHQAFREFLLARAHTIADRLAASAAFLRRFEAVATRDGAAAGSALLTGPLPNIPELAAETRRSGHASAGRRVLSLFMLQDREEGRVAAVRRFAALALFRAGGVRLHSRAMQASASWRQLRRVEFDSAGAAANDLLTRYLSAKLESRRYVAGDVTLLEGVNMLVAAYGIVDTLARTKAASERRPACTESDIRDAVSAADLLVLEHPALLHGGLHRRLVKAALGTSEAAADVLACLAHSRSAS